MIIEIIRWASLVMLWVCIGLYVWLIRDNLKIRKQLVNDHMAYTDAINKTWAARDVYYEELERIKVYDNREDECSPSPRGAENH